MFTRKQWRSGTVRAVIFTLIAVITFPVPVIARGSTDITSGTVYKNIKAGPELAGPQVGGIIVMGNGLVSVYGKYFCKSKDSAVHGYYQEDSVLHPLFYLLGSIFTLILVLHYTLPSSEGPAAITSPNIGEAVYSIATDVAWITPVSVVLMPFLLNYGVMDFIGSLMEPLMRPVLKTPGGSAVNAITSFVSSIFVGVLTTSKLYRKGIHTKEEAALIATGLSAVSVGFAYKVTKTADLSEYFLPIYFIALLVTLIVSSFMAKIPPLSHKVSVFADGRQQTKEEILAECVPARTVLKTGALRAVKKAATVPNLLKEIRSNLLDSCYVLSKVISLLAAVGVTAMLITVYTPVFNWTDKLFESLLVLLQVLNAAEIAPSLPVGTVEMFLPVPITVDKVDTLAVGIRYMIVAVPMVQIIFFSETIVVMVPMKILVSLKKPTAYFSERTIVVIPISALFMHLLF